MQCKPLHVPWHVRLTCALRRHVRWPFSTSERVDARLLPDAKTGLSDRLADDIGLSMSERERLRLRLPSQTTRHPML